MISLLDWNWCKKWLIRNLTYPSDDWCTSLSSNFNKYGTLGPQRSTSNRPT